MWQLVMTAVVEQQAESDPCGGLRARPAIKGCGRHRRHTVPLCNQVSAMDDDDLPGTLEQHQLLFPDQLEFVGVHSAQFANLIRSLAPAPAPSGFRWRYVR